MNDDMAVPVINNDVNTPQSNRPTRVLSMAGVDGEPQGL